MDIKPEDKAKFLDALGDLADASLAEAKAGKNPLTSKTVWLGIIMVASAVAVIFGVEDTTAQAVAGALGTSGIITIVLRYFTKEPIGTEKP